MPDILVESFDLLVTDAATLTLSNDVGSLNSAFVKINNSTRKGSAGPTTTTSTADPNELSVGVELTATDTLTFHTDGPEQRVMGEVWRYVGDAGGGNEYIVRGRYAITLTGATATATLSGHETLANCVPFLTGFTTTNTSASTMESSTLGVRLDGTNVEVSRQDTTGSCVAYVTVVEFVGDNWTIASGVSSSHDDVAESVTLSADILNWDNAFIEATGQGDTTETGLADIHFIAWPGATTSTVWVSYVLADSSARNDGTAYVYVMSNPQISVSRNTQGTQITEGNGSYGTDLSFPAGANTSRSLDQLSLEWFVSTSGTGAAHGRGHVGARITDASGTVRHWVHRTGNTVICSLGIVDLSQLDSPAPAVGMNVWDGSAWVHKPVMVWSGTVWEAKPVKHWNGSNWV